MKTRRLIGLYVVLALSLIGTGCAGQSSRPSAVGATVSLYGDLEHLDPRGEVITVWYPASHEDALLAMLDRFNRTNRWGIAVRGERLEDSAALYERILEGASAKKLPDMAIVSPGYLGAIATKGLAVELTPYVKSRQWGFPVAELEEFFPSVLEVGELSQPSGRYGFPFALSAGLLVYNRGRLHQLGYDHPPRTWEEFREMACAASDPTSGIYGYEFAASGPTFVRLLIGWGGQMMSPDRKEYTFGGAEGLEALTFLQAMVQEGCALREAHWEQAEADFGAGRALFVLSNTWHIPHYRQVAAKREGLDWAVAPLPTSTGAPATDLFGLSWFIPPTTPRRQLAAWLVVRWMNEQPQQERWVSAYGYLPHRPLSPEARDALLEETPQYADALALLELDAVVEPAVPGYEQCRDILGAMVSAVAEGEDPAFWLNWAAESCQAALGGP
ncbi:MAG: extracellular solute-binding protein [Thermoflexales bacterium]|nr:extracellular solute-binding protein [Thermoflexales bacterium]